MIPAVSTRAWTLISTPPLTGSENMEIDRQTLARVDAGFQGPTLRFFRWSRHEFSFGRLQQADPWPPHLPAEAPRVQRPTGGGIVAHGDDLCLSLCWPTGHPPLPRRPTEQYAWIHRVLLAVLQRSAPVRLAQKGDERLEGPFGLRQCFTQPVGCDVLAGDAKVAGGALAKTRGATLYQGSIQGLSIPDLESRLAIAFERALNG
jgi:lipoate-protein ligase A